MIDIAALREELLRIYQTGTTQQEISEKTGVAQSYIADLMSGKKKFGGLTLRKINQLFPDATINLHGDTVMADNSGALVENDTPANIEAAFLIDKIDRIVDSDELTAEEKVKVLKVLTK